MANLTAYSPNPALIDGQDVNAVNANSQHIPATARLTQLSNHIQVETGNSNQSISQNQETLVLCTNTSNITVTINASAANQLVTKSITIKKVGSNAATVQIIVTGGDTIGAPFASSIVPVTTSFFLYLPGEEITITGSGNVWYPIGYHLPVNECRFRAEPTAGYTLGAGITRLTLNNVTGGFKYNIGGTFDTANSRFVAPFKGVYALSPMITGSALAVDCSGVLNINGASSASLNIVAPLIGRHNLNAAVCLGGSFQLVLEAGDFVDIYLSGASRNVLLGFTYFEGRLVSRL